MGASCHRRPRGGRGAAAQAGGRVAALRRLSRAPRSPTSSCPRRIPPTGRSPAAVLPVVPSQTSSSTMPSPHTRRCAHRHAREFSSCSPHICYEVGCSCLLIHPSSLLSSSWLLEFISIPLYLGCVLSDKIGFLHPTQFRSLGCGLDGDSSPQAPAFQYVCF